jgi:hypothetical protein
MTDEQDSVGSIALPGKAKPAAKAAVKIVTSEEFITASPLFIRVATGNFAPPSKITFDCTECKAETDWLQVYSPTVLGSAESTVGKVADYTIRSVAYQCFRCSHTDLTVIYKELEHEKRVLPVPPGTGISRSGIDRPPVTFTAVTEVMKIGQYPALAVYVPRALEENLGKDAAALYRKALLTRNMGYGLAAVGYMRRVVEDKTNELIEVAAEFAETNNVDATTVAKIRAVLDPTKYTPYEKKLEIAASVFPGSLKAGDVKPLQVLFQQVSKGLHGLSEEECVNVADEIKLVFEYVFENLRAQVTSRKAFVAQLKKIS